MRRVLRRLLQVLAVLLVLTFFAALAAAGWLTHQIGEATEALRPRVTAMRALKETGPGWAFPSVVYSDWFEIAPDAGHGLGRLERELRARGYTRVDKDEAEGPLDPGEYARPGREALRIGLRGFDFPDGAGAPATIRVEGDRRGHITEIVPESGASWPVPWRLEPLFLDEWLPESNELRRPVELASLPRHVADAVVASEDARFREHGGVDLRGIARALRRNVLSGGRLEGGSTLTQQLVRTFFLTRERSYRRKINEAIQAIALERVLSKDEILEMYLTAVYLGQVGGRAIGGVAAGARAWFGVEPQDLTLEQAATLAAIIPSPNTRSPLRDPALCRDRRDRVLDRMAELGYVSAAEADAAKARPLEIKPAAPPAGRWPLHAAWARRALTAELGRDPGALGLRVFTGLDPALQTEAEAGVATEVELMEAALGRFREDPLEGAALGLDPQTGLVLFAVPGRGRAGNQFHRAVQARRQPGSAIKPVAYAAVFSARDEAGHHRFTPAHTVADERRAFDTPEGPWRPRNSDGLYHPWVSVAKAFAKSMNVATTNLVVQVGPEAVAEMGRRLGITSEMRPVPSIGLGSSEITLVELVGALSVVASEGRRVPVTPVRIAVDATGEVVWRAPERGERVLGPAVLGMLTSLMRASYERGTGYTARHELGRNREVAGKTGTSQQGRDLWFVGVTPRLAMGFWMGHDQGRAMQQIAGETIAPAWGRVARTLFEDSERIPFPVPDGVELVTIDPYSGCRGGGFPVLMPAGQPFPQCRPIDWEIPRREKPEDEADDDGASPPGGRLGGLGP